MTARDILQAALALPEEERLMMIEELEASLPDDKEEEAFAAMINDRVAAAEAGEPGIPAADVFARLRDDDGRARTDRARGARASA